MDGYSLGSMEGSQLGCNDGIAVVWELRKADGTTVKVDDGSELDIMDGSSLGSMEGSQLGCNDGIAVGSMIGNTDGTTVKVDDG